MFDNFYDLNQGVNFKINHNGMTQANYEVKLTYIEYLV